MGPLNSGVWTQWWEVSVLNGDTCTGEHTLHGQLTVNGHTHNLEPSTKAYILSVGVISEVLTWPGVSYATLTPQTATIVLTHKIKNLIFSSLCGLRLPLNNSPYRMS